MRHSIPGNTDYLGVLTSGNQLVQSGVRPDRTPVGVNLGGEVEIIGGWTSVAGGKNGYSIRFGLDVAKAWVDQSVGNFDPGPGNSLSIFGPRGATSGIVLGFNPQNIVQNVTYSNDLVSASPYINMEKRFERKDYAFGVFLGVLYSYLHMTEEFGATVPGFLSSFNYITKLTTHAFGSHIGARGRMNIGAPINGWQPQLSARGQIGIAHVKGSLEDSVAWGGNIATVLADSTQQVSANTTATYFSIGGAFAVNNIGTQTQIFVDLQYDQRPWFGSAIRNGVDPTSLSFVSADVFAAVVGFRLRR